MVEDGSPSDEAPESERTRENAPLTEELARATLEERDDVTSPSTPAYERVAQSMRPPAPPRPWVGPLGRFVEAWTRAERLLAALCVGALIVLLVGFVVLEVQGGAVSIFAGFGGPRGLFSRLILWLAMVGVSIAANATLSPRRDVAVGVRAALAVLAVVVFAVLGGGAPTDVDAGPLGRLSEVVHEGTFRALLLVVAVKLGLAAALRAAGPAEGRG